MKLGSEKSHVIISSKDNPELHLDPPPSDDCGRNALHLCEISHDDQYFEDREIFERPCNYPQFLRLCCQPVAEQAAAN